VRSSQLWSWYEPYLTDAEEFNIDGSPASRTTVGQYVIRLLTDQEYFGDRLPRIPVLVQRNIDANLKLLAEGRLSRGVACGTAVDGGAGSASGAACSSAGSAAANGESRDREERIKRKRMEIASQEEKVWELRQRITDKEAELRRCSDRD